MFECAQTSAHSHWCVNMGIRVRVRECFVCGRGSVFLCFCVRGCESAAVRRQTPTQTRKQLEEKKSSTSNTTAWSTEGVRAQWVTATKEREREIHTQTDRDTPTYHSLRSEGWISRCLHGSRIESHS